jgi:hypothetical protein
MSRELIRPRRPKGWQGLICLLLAGTAMAQTPAKPRTPPEIEYGYPEQSIFVATTNARGEADSPMTNVAAALMERVGLPWHAAPYPQSSTCDTSPSASFGSNHVDFGGIT